MGGSSASESESASEEDTFDYELNLLAMQFQKYAYRRLYVSDIWLTWTLLDAECYDLNARDNKGVPPIVYAAKRGSLVLLWLLLRYKADVNAITRLRESALIVACRKKRVRVVRFLLEHGASPDVLDRTGYSALRWAVEHEHLRLLRLLLFHNASVMKDCYARNSALEIAMKGSSKTHTIMMDALQQRLVDEPRELLVQVTVKKEQDEVDAISQFRDKKTNKKATQDKKSDAATAVNDGGSLQDKPQLHRRHRHGRKDKLLARGGQLARVHVSSAAAAAAQDEEASEALARPPPLERSSAMKKLLQERLDDSTGVWVRAGPGKWTAQRREAQDSSSATPLAAAAATQVVAFDAPLDDKMRRRTRDLLKSDVRWNAFLKTLNSELGHETTEALHLEDLE